MTPRDPRLDYYDHDDSIDPDDVVFVDGEPVALITDDDEDDSNQEKSND